MWIWGKGHALPRRRLSTLSQATLIECYNSVGLLGNFGLVEVVEVAWERVRAPSGLMGRVSSLLYFGSLSLDTNIRIKAAGETLQTTGEDPRVRARPHYFLQGHFVNKGSFPWRFPRDFDRSTSVPKSYSIIVSESFSSDYRQSRLHPPSVLGVQASDQTNPPAMRLTPPRVRDHRGR